MKEMGGIWGRAVPPAGAVRLAGRLGVMKCVMGSGAQGGLTDKELLTWNPEHSRGVPDLGKPRR